MFNIKVIAEVGCNHKGEMDIAKKLIEVAAKTCDADVVKFQKRSNKDLLTPEQYNAPHPNPQNSYGDTYGAHREFLELSIEQHKELQEECRMQGIEYSTSVWDLKSAKEVSALKPSLIKIPSATNQHYELQEYLCKNYDGEIHVSTGMTTHDEIDELISFYEERGRSKDLVVYACTSGYPVEFQDICLLEIRTLQEKYGDKVRSIGFSGHHLGIAADIAAMTIGVLGEMELGKGKFEYVERHFTLDRTWKGTDHAASLEPGGMRRLCRDLKAVKKAISHKDIEILAVEQVQRDKLKWKQEDHASAGLN